MVEEDDDVLDFGEFEQAVLGGFEGVGLDGLSGVAEFSFEDALEEEAVIFVVVDDDDGDRFGFCGLG